MSYYRKQRKGKSAGAGNNVSISASLSILEIPIWCDNNWIPSPTISFTVLFQNYTHMCSRGWTDADRAGGVTSSKIPRMFCEQNWKMGITFSIPFLSSWWPKGCAKVSEKICNCLHSLLSYAQGAGCLWMGVRGKEGWVLKLTLSNNLVGGCESEVPGIWC